MTLQQEATDIINSLPDDGIRFLIDLFRYDYLKSENNKTIERAYNMTKLSVMCDLETGWDGESAKPISRDLIAFVSSILMRINKQPEIYPTAEGGIQIQYEKPDKTYMEIVFSPDSIVGMKIDKGNAETAEFTDFDYTSGQNIADYIRKFNNA